MPAPRLVPARPEDQHDDDDGEELQADAPAHQGLRRVGRPRAQHMDEPEDEDERDGAHRDRDAGVGECGHRVSLSRRGRRPLVTRRAENRQTDGRRSVALQQALEVVALLSGAVGVGKAAAQFFEHAVGALGCADRVAEPPVHRIAARAALAPERIAAILAALARPSRGFDALAVFAAFALHLLLQPLRTFAQRLQRLALLADRAALALAARLQVAFGLAHRLAGVVEALLALESLALHATLQFRQTVAQRLLLLVERRRVLILIALPGLLVVLRLAFVRLILIVRQSMALALTLISAEGVVAHGLLVAHQFVELAHFAAQLAFGRAHASSRALHVLEEVLQLVEHRLRLRLVAGARGV